MTQIGSVITLSPHLDDRDPHSSPEPVRDVAAFDLGREYDAHAPALFGFAINALRDRGLAEDCVQETFLRAWRSRTSFDARRATARTWLFAIERNVIVDLRRSLARMPRIGNADALDGAAADNPDELERLRVVEALAKLSDEHRQVVVAVQLRGGSYAELAEATGIPVATLRTRMFYALRALRDHLEGKEGRDD